MKLSVRLAANLRRVPALLILVLFLSAMIAPVASASVPSDPRTAASHSELPVLNAAPVPAAAEQTPDIQQAAADVQAPPPAAPQTAPESAPAIASGATSYTVQPGDTLSAIAAAKGTSWEALYARNIDVVGDNPNVIRKGMTLALDVSATPAPTEAPSEPAPSAAPAAAPARQDWVHPFPEYTHCSSEYGMRTHPITGRRKMHSGQDLSNRASGSPVLSVADGTVRTAERRGSYGNVVVIEHDNGMFTEYGHLLDDSMRVDAGGRVEAGEQIARVGNTGGSTGAHLHFAVAESMFDERINPSEYMADRGVDLC